MAFEKKENNSSPDFVKKANDALSQAENDLGAFEHRQKEEIRQDNVEERKNLAEELNKKRGFIDKIRGNKLENETSVGYGEALNVDKWIDVILRRGEVENRTEAMKVFFKNEMRERDRAAYDKYLGLLEKAERSQKELDMALSMVMMNDPLRAERAARAEKSYVDTAMELERLGLHNKAADLREKAHAAAVEAALKYDSQELPLREVVESKIDTGITEAILSPGKVISVQILDSRRGWRESDAVPHDEEVQYVTEAIRMVYDKLGIAYSLRENINPKPEKGKEIHLWQDEIYSAGNAEYNIREIYTYFSPQNPSKVEIEIQKIGANDIKKEE